ncbi:MAG: efflux RND transporter permease subunit [Gammaproteobacteria bacterium]|nr:efflux RND transporter permease subunit [Gammaproteobacteria bacterium]
MKITSFTDVFIRRPVLASVISLILLLVGVRAFFALPVRLFPKIDATVVSIDVTYPGAGADLMESFVTTPVESAISGVDGLDYITSSSSQGESRVTAHFKLGYDINQAVSDINSKVSSVRYKLPKDVNDPVVRKNDPNAFPVMFLAFTSKDMPREELSDKLLRIVQPMLQTLPGVASADIWGPQYAMRIWLDPSKMSARGVTPNDIFDALNAGNLQAAAGKLDSASQEYALHPITDLSSSEQFRKLIVYDDNNTPVRIMDVGDAKLGATNHDIDVRADGEKAVVIALMAKSNANPLDISKEVQRHFPAILHALPSDIKAKTFWDSANYIHKSIVEVMHTIIEAAIFVIIVVFLFLGSLRTLLIPTIAIPLSLIGVCGVMLLFGYSINTLTLLALVLAIGMVVDDAIVVSENIHRHLAEGKSPIDAALIGAREIKFAVISMTLTLAAVYAPIGFTTGLTGSLFREFAFTLASAVIISGFLALTLSPMMCSRIITTGVLNGKLANYIHRVTDKLAEIYRHALELVLRIRWGVVFGLLLILVATYFLYLFLPSELAPKEDEGFILSLVTAPTSANLDYTKKYTSEFANIYKKVPEIQNYLTINGEPNGVNSAYSLVKLKDWSKRKRDVNAILKEIRPQLFAVPGVQAFAMNPSSLPGSDSFMPIMFVLKTTGSYTVLNNAMQKLLAEVRKNPAIINANSDLNIDKPQLNIKINRDKAASLGIGMQAIANALNVSLAEPTVTRFSMGGYSYNVIPEIEDRFSKTSNVLRELNVRTASGELTPLDNIVSIENSVEPQSLNHFQQMRAATLQASTVPGYTLSDALNYLEKAAQKVLPKGVEYDFAGTSRQFVEEGSQMLFTFLFAIIFIYLVLAAQFESFVDPLIVMLTVPLSTMGALLTLHIIGGTLNIYSEIGIITLVGLISKHGILMVEFANQLQEVGVPLRDAILQAASIRLRPILMTTCAMILGALPLALATGAGAVSRQQIGWTIVGGMLVGTLFTLFVIPTMYTFLAVDKANKV